jgi:hypothetical protein
MDMVVAGAGRGETGQESGVVRKVHHPKIVQRADSLWVVVCNNCARDCGSPRPVDIDAPISSLAMARVLWEKHYQSGRGPVRRGAEEFGGNLFPEVYGAGES